LLCYLDCGIRPATTAEAEWLQDYIQKSNNNSAQSSVNAARLAQEQAESSTRSEERSEDEEDEDSEGVNSSTGSKRNSLSFTNEVPASFPQDMNDKTPTAATLLSQVQASQRPMPAYPHHASIRRHPNQESGLIATSHPSAGSTSMVYGTSQGALSVRQLASFPSIDEAVGTNSTSSQSIAAREAWNWFQDHLDALMDSIRAFRFDQFEMNMRSFWSNLAGQHREVVHAPAIAGLMAKADAIVYDVSD